MKNTLILAISCCAFLTTACLADTASKSNEDKLNLAGTYTCNGNDSYIGPYKATMVLTLDQGATNNFKEKIGAYTLKFDATVPNDPTYYNYTGEAIANGHSMAIYYQNSDEKNDANDRGVGLANIVRTHDSTGKLKLSFTKLYFEPKYFRDKKGPTTGLFGGTGTDHCVKQ